MTKEAKKEVKEPTVESGWTAKGYSIVRNNGNNVLVQIDFMANDFGKNKFTEVYKDEDYDVVEEQFRLMVAKNMFMTQDK